MDVKQFQDKPLAHYSYAIVSDGKMALVDPSRDPGPYYRYALEKKARIVAVFETHPHADFVSSHLQVHKETGAGIYVSRLVGAAYPHIPFDEGDTFRMGQIRFSAVNTPGHSPDSITVIAREGEEYAMFSGDTLFIGDVGRPDLREHAGNMKAKREALARDMYRTVHNKFNHLPDTTVVYPAHGAGSLCGKNLGSEASGTLGNERMGNWAFRTVDEETFVQNILKDQPFIPAYFGYDVELNRNGAESAEGAIAGVRRFLDPQKTDAFTFVDVRDGKAFREGHFPGSINIMARTEDDKFETWLGSIVKPGEPFYLVVPDVDHQRDVMNRVVKIGYEKQMVAVIIPGTGRLQASDAFDYEAFRRNPEDFTVVDVRNQAEVAQQPFFGHAIHIPLPELRDRVKEIPADKPLVVHCAGGYRSAAGSSIAAGNITGIPVYDLGDRIEDFRK
ncbi:MBL fold metallo-hydrolase [Sinomicrobium soli]|uniref:MBL fold metallo-hydrolase n=1 Tax=Sinomicrobium sp. N-1-3-6 TaxID=2219864 RepID=UPI000DCD9A0E|nr:MBL fold metallo-hydrolase [Sinomicrobium sp. N-1-3-6]RAV29968.1 MBL fold metallo-hydrolase [Sinomicrobium sp. N-1-3-6]